MADSEKAMQGIVAMAIGVLSLLIIFIIIPLVGSQLETAVTLPASGTGSMWNSSVNANIPTAYGAWASLAGILKVAAILVIIGGFLRTLQGLRSDTT